MVAKRKTKPPPAVAACSLEARWLNSVLDTLAADCAGGKSDYVSVPVAVLLKMIAVCGAGAA